MRGTEVKCGSQWFVSPAPKPAASHRLVCFPYAGGTAATYSSWARHLPEHVELVAIQLAGREARFNEPFATSLESTVEQLADVFDVVADKSFTLFGHSMGAILAFELARTLRARGESLPCCLIVSGKRAPQDAPSATPFHKLPHEQFIDKIMEYAGTHSEILANTALMELLLPRLRADFQLSETYRYRQEGPLGCRLATFVGIDDPETSIDSIGRWSEHSCQDHEVELFPGGHFFIHSARERVVDRIVRRLPN